MNIFNNLQTATLANARIHRVDHYENGSRVSIGLLIDTPAKQVLLETYPRRSDCGTIHYLTTKYSPTGELIFANEPLTGRDISFLIKQTLQECEHL